MKHSLSIYHISVYERRKKENRSKINDINGVDLLKIVDGFIKNWLQGSTPIQTPTNESKAFRLGEESGHWLYERKGRLLEGIIESGEYGQELDVYDVKTGNKAGTIHKHQAPLLPFYFIFHLPDESYDGYLILQKNGNNGIYSILTTELLNYAATKITGDYTINISPFVLSSLRDRAWEQISEARSIIIKESQPQILPLLDSLGLGTLDSHGIRSEVKYTVQKGGTFPLTSYLKNLIKRGHNEAEVSEIDKRDMTGAEISLEVKMPDGNFRTISLASINSLGTSLSLKDDCMKNDKGFPQMGILHSESIRLIEMIKNNGKDTEKAD